MANSNSEPSPNVAWEGTGPIAYRVVWGLLGGAIATASKYVAQDWYWYRVFRDTKDYEAIDGMLWAYLILLVMLCFIGAVVAAAFQDERHPMKLLWLGVAAPALVTTWLGGQFSAGQANYTPKKSWLPSVTTTALAADSAIGQTDSFWRGAAIVFGFGKDQTRYRVIIGSYRTRADAVVMLERVKRVRPDLNVYIDEPRRGSEFFGVYVGEPLPLSEARDLRDEISEAIGVKDAYLARYP